MSRHYNILVISMILFCFMCVLSSNKAFAEDKNFAIYPTTNTFTSLELDTRDGRVWQVHTGIKKEHVITKLPIIDWALTTEPFPGRFVLSPTGNMYNFILLDTSNGRTWQLQWSFDESQRGVIQEIK